MRVDIPVRQVLPDLAILGIAQRAPSSAKELRQARGVDDRHTKGGIADEILEAVAEGVRSEPPVAPKSTDDLDRSLRPAVTLISAWVSQLARDERIDTALLATRADLVAFLRGDDDARLASGWRNDLLGDGITRARERPGRPDVRRRATGPRPHVIWSRSGQTPTRPVQTAASVRRRRAQS